MLQPPPLSQADLEFAASLCPDAAPLAPGELPRYSLWRDFCQAWNWPFSYVPGMRMAAGGPGTACVQSQWARV